MHHRRLAAVALTLTWLLALPACQQPVTYGTQIGIRGGDRDLDARDRPGIDRPQDEVEADGDQPAEGQPR